MKDDKDLWVTISAAVVAATMGGLAAGYSWGSREQFRLERQAVEGSVESETRLLLTYRAMEINSNRRHIRADCRMLRKHGVLSAAAIDEQCREFETGELSGDIAMPR